MKVAKVKTPSNEGQNWANGSVLATGMTDEFVGGTIFLAGEAKGDKCGRAD